MRFDHAAWFLYGGEDYELLFAAAPEFDLGQGQTGGSALTRIGTFDSSVKGVQLKLNNGTILNVEKSGWDHVSRH